MFEIKKEDKDGGVTSRDQLVMVGLADIELHYWRPGGLITADTQQIFLTCKRPGCP